MTNRLLKGAHLSERKCREIIHLFREDLNATQIAHVTHVSRITVNSYLKKIRMAIAAHNLPAQLINSQDTVNGQESPLLYGVFRNYKRIQIIPLQGYEIGALEEIHRLYPEMHAVIDFGNWRLHRLDNNLHANGSPAMDEISGFWGWIKSRLQKFRGLHRNTIYLHVKESEFRYNHRDDSMEDHLQRLLFANDY
ncbi:hypothetical protein [Flavihumibacter petaseus]|uniref:Uncharacterized protein n=1 Tax=Flavihumibacter petaseus NBRC 106054 TaxID=1220578 RepID=A0A0E9MYV7_9BACT|nr:hypothetical protein [Flavihumibacter petaseus]GAO42897.1 hypothetical protein FPE01S_02_00020 [Flavihumibacter petaseus NBRC 106054]